MKTTRLKKQVSQYVKIVDWSEEDACFVGRCPELFLGGVHGADEPQVYAQLCSLVEEVLNDKSVAKIPPPKPKIAPNYSGKFLLRTSPELHKALSMRALREGKSLNQIVLESLTAKAAS